MLAWLAMTTVRADRRMVAGRTSRPTRNMKSTRPTWLSAYKGPRPVDGNSAFIAAGEIRPRNDGPSSSPAAISPTTAGWRINRKAAPTRRAATRTTSICRNRSFNSGTAEFLAPMRYEALLPLFLTVLHAEIPVKKSQAEQDAVESQKGGQDQGIRAAHVEP